MINGILRRGKYAKMALAFELVTPKRGGALTAKQGFRSVPSSAIMTGKLTHISDEDHGRGDQDEADVVGEELSYHHLVPLCERG